jgi:polyhydroxybutyrate depolymerase
MMKQKQIMLLALIVGLFGLVFTVRPAQAANAVCDLSVQTGAKTEKITSGSIERTYTLILPKSYDGKTALPVVFSLHGFASNPGQQFLFAGFEKIGEREGFITIYPAATGSPARWYAGTTSFTGPERVDDVQFFADLLDDLNKRLCIDNARIFVTGLSNGGGMSHRLACDLSARIAAIGTVAGAYPSIQTQCNAARPVPVIAFHGTEDRIVDYKGSAMGRLPDIQAWAAEWAQRNGCQKGPTSFFSKDDVTAAQWTECSLNADVQLYTIEGGGHSWPGGGLDLPMIIGKTTKTISASEVMWEFFKAHPFPQAP